MIHCSRSSRVRDLSVGDSTQMRRQRHIGGARGGRGWLSVRVMKRKQTCVDRQT